MTRILAGRPRGEIPNLVADRRPAWPVRMRPVPGNQAAMPGQQRGRGDDAVLP
jgi:hypothetical protein